MQRKLWRVGIKVADYEGQKAFYRDVLGWPITEALEERPNQKFCFFDAGSALFYIMWEAPKEGEAPPAGKNRARVDLQVDDVQAAWRALEGRVSESKGPPHSTRFGRTGFSVRDPEGTTIHFFQGDAP